MSQHPAHDERGGLERVGVGVLKFFGQREFVGGVEIDQLGLIVADGEAQFFDAGGQRVVDDGFQQVLREIGAAIVGHYAHAQDFPYVGLRIERQPAHGADRRFAIEQNKTAAVAQVVGDVDGGFTVSAGGDVDLAGPRFARELGDQGSIFSGRFANYYVHA